MCHTQAAYQYKTPELFPGLRFLMKKNVLFIL